VTPREALCFPFTIALVLAALPALAYAQRSAQRDREFVTSLPAAGDPLPDVSVYTPEGRPLHTADLRGHYTVLVFGCLT
jgi:cytochrome oxidase Cu insertion factor (SCO1/SenC/PrrC family)